MAEYNTDLIAGGIFTSAGGVPAQNIAAWNGQVWRALGDANGEVTSLTVFDGELIAGGAFTEVGGVIANRVARWDGSTWRPLGSGLDGNVEALYADGPDLYVGGRFSTAGGVSARNIARWTGSAWQNLGTGVGTLSTDQVETIGEFNGVLIAAGKFEHLGNIAYWSDGVWTRLGQGIPCPASSERVLDVATLGTDHFVGGRFVETNGGTGRRFLRWSGPVPSGTFVRMIGNEPNSAIQAFLPRPGFLYAGGAFTSFTNLPSTHHVARWNGSTWGRLGTESANGVDGEVFALTEYRGNIIVGGSFTNAAGVPATDVASWGCPLPTCDPDVTCDGSVNGFDIEAMELAVNGEFTDFCQWDPDFNHDGTVNGFDVEAVEQGVNGAPCP